eukprot:g2487.t1
MARSVVWLEVGGRVGVTGLGRDCVGVIISPSRVLTAAACFFPGDPTRATSPSASPKGTTGAATAGTPYNRGTSVLKSFNVQVVAGSLLQELGRDGVRTHLWDTLLKNEGVLIDDARLQAHRFDFYTRGVQVDELVAYRGNGIVVVDFAKVPVRAVAIGVVEDRKQQYCGDGPGTRVGDPGSDSEEELSDVDRVLAAAIEKKRAETAKSSRSAGGGAGGGRK